MAPNETSSTEGLIRLLSNNPMRHFTNTMCVHAPVQCEYDVIVVATVSRVSHALLATCTANSVKQCGTAWLLACSAM